MVRYRVGVCTLLVFAAGTWLNGSAQIRPDSAPLIAAQREAMKAFAMMDGVWRGPAWTMMGWAEKHSIMQTERIGPFLDGSIKVIEGRGYNEDGSVGFNAFGIISYDPAKKVYKMHSHAQGHVGDFVIKPTADDYVWEIPAGQITIRYTAVIKDGTCMRLATESFPVKNRSASSR